MTRYSVQPKDRLFVKGYEFLFFAKNIGKDVGKNITKNVSSKHSQKLLDHAKKFAADSLKTASNIPIQKTAEATGDLICNKVADKITSKTSPQNNSETSEEKMLRERYISPEQDRKLLMI